MKTRTRVFACLLAVLCFVTAFSLSSLAVNSDGHYASDENGEYSPPDSIDSINISTVNVGKPSGSGGSPNIDWSIDTDVPDDLSGIISGFLALLGNSGALTPSGNLTLVDDILQDESYTVKDEKTLQHRLKQIEQGNDTPEAFLRDISELTADLVRDYEVIKDAEILFPSGREELGPCPRCGSPVTESKLGFFCERTACKFGLWRDNRFLSDRKILLTKKMVSELLNDGRTFVNGIYSERKGRCYDAYILMEDDGTHSTYKLSFEKGKR